MKIQLYGKAGDIIYCMAAVKAMAVQTRQEFDLVISSAKWSNDEFSLEAAKQLAVFLCEQEYVRSAVARNWNESFDDCACQFKDWFDEREFYGKNLCESSFNFASTRFSYSTELQRQHIEQPWLTCKSNFDSWSLVSWTGRYLSKDSRKIWNQVLEKIDPLQTRFIGFQDEHKRFTNLCDIDLELVDTRTFSDAARYVARAARLYSNQSALLAVAHGMGIPVTVEVSSKWPDCILLRDQAEYLPKNKRRDLENGLDWGEQ